MCEGEYDADDRYKGERECEESVGVSVNAKARVIVRGNVRRTVRAMVSESVRVNGV